MLTVGIPKEIKAREKRVGLIPTAVAELTRRRVNVLVEKGAGIGSGFSDEQYVARGAQILPDAASVYARADFIQKVKEPLEAEFSLLRKQQILFCFLHLASPANCELVQAILEKNITAIGYETLVVDGKTPILKPMSEIAGGLSASYAAYFLNSKLAQAGKMIYPSGFHEELEKIAAQYPKPLSNGNIGEVVVFGGGVAGTQAARFALTMKGKVVLIEKNQARRESLDKEWGRAGLKTISLESLSDTMLESADVLIGSVHIPGYRAPRMLDASRLEKVSTRKKKIIMDISIDQGGNFPESHATSYDDPVYLDPWGNLRFGVANIPSLCGKAASDAISEATLVYTLSMSQDFQSALRQFPELKSAVNIQNSSVLIPAIKEAHRL